MTAFVNADDVNAGQAETEARGARGVCQNNNKVYNYTIIMIVAVWTGGDWGIAASSSFCQSNPKDAHFRPKTMRESPQLYTSNLATTVPT